MSSSAGQNKAGAFRDREKPHDVRVSNITAAKGRYTHRLYVFG